MSIRIISDTRAKRKQASALELIAAFGPNGYFLEDALEYFKTQMLAVETNFNPVGIVTGNLRRSYATAGLYQRLPYVIRLTPNLSVAPYVPEVSERIRKRFGKSFVQLVIERCGAEVDAAIAREMRRSLAVINSGGQYRYENPFPGVPSAAGRGAA